MPLAALHLQLPVDLLETYRAGDGRFEVSGSWANSFITDRTFLIDAETVRLTLGGWYAALDDFYLGAELPLHLRDSGVLDPLIDGVHNSLGFGDGNRSKQPRNQYEISITEPNGRRTELDRGVGVGDFVFKTHWNVNTGRDWYPAVSIQGLLALPTSTNGFGSTGADVGMALAFSKRVLEPIYLYAVLGGTYLTDPSTHGIHYEREGYQAIAGLEVALSKRVSFVFQTMNFTPLLDRPSPLNRKRNYLAGGFKWEYLDGFTLDLSLIENLYPFTSSADIGLATTLGFRF